MHDFKRLQSFNIFYLSYACINKETDNVHDCFSIDEISLPPKHTKAIPSYNM